MLCPRGGWQHATCRTTVYSRVQGAAGVGGTQRAQDRGRGLPRVPAQARSADALEGRLRDPCGQCVRGRRAQPTGRAAHRRVGADGGAPHRRAEGGKKSCAALSREQRRQVSEQLCAEYPLAVLCRVLDLPRSSLYAREQRRLVDDGDDEEQRVRVHIERIAGQWPTYGYRRGAPQTPPPAARAP